jgi:hypothetical protein
LIRFGIKSKTIKANRGTRGKLPCALLQGCRNESISRQGRIRRQRWAGENIPMEVTQ